MSETTPILEVYPNEQYYPNKDVYTLFSRLLKLTHETRREGGSLIRDGKIEAIASNLLYLCVTDHCAPLLQKWFVDLHTMGLDQAQGFDVSHHHTNGSAGIRDIKDIAAVMDKVCQQKYFMPLTELIARLTKQNNQNLSDLRNQCELAVVNCGDHEVREALWLMGNYLARIGAVERMNTVFAHILEAKTEKKKKAEVDPNEVVDPLAPTEEDTEEVDQDNATVNVNDIKLMPFVSQPLENLPKLNSTETSAKIHIRMTMARTAFLRRKAKFFSEQLSALNELFQCGGDWESKNRFRIYKAMENILVGKEMEEATSTLVSSLSTYSAEELMDYSDFALISIVTAMSVLPRPELKKLSQVPEILELAGSAEQLNEKGKPSDLGIALAFRLLKSMVDCKYIELLPLYSTFIRYLKMDNQSNPMAASILRPHQKSLLSSMRMTFYKQYLRPYNQVSMAAMASAFGVSPAWLEQDLVSFIPEIRCTIDRINGIVYRSMESDSSSLEATVVETASDLLNKLNAVSRLIGV